MSSSIGVNVSLGVNRRECVRKNSSEIIIDLVCSLLLGKAFHIIQVETRMLNLCGLTGMFSVRNGK